MDAATVADIAESPALSGTHALAGTRIVCVSTIRKPASELYEFWRDVKNLPQLSRVPVHCAADGDGQTQWVAKAPRGRQQFQWDLIVTEAIPPRLISWQSLPGSAPVHQGSIRFTPAPADEGTEVSVTIEYDEHGPAMAAWTSPTGGLASWATKIKGQGLRFHITEALRRFKALMECGEMPTTEGQPSGNRKGGR